MRAMNTSIWCPIWLSFEKFQIQGLQLLEYLNFIHKSEPNYFNGSYIFGDNLKHE